MLLYVKNKKYFKLYVKGMRQVSPAVDVTSEVSGSHFRFVRETF
jgi:beta-xylosidase